MSRKSGLSNGLSFERPRVERELPHHLPTLGGGGSRRRRGGVGRCERLQADGRNTCGHPSRIGRVSPDTKGTVVTGLTLKRPEWRNAVYARTPMRRVAAPEEIAELAVFLAR
jgi:hypothetical protein